MASGTNIGTAYISIIPEMKGIQGTIAKELGAERVGTDAGRKLGEGIAKGASQSSSELMKSFGSVGDRIAFKTKASLGLAFDNVAKAAKDRIGGVASTIGERFKAVGQAISGSAIGKAFSSVAGIASAAFSKVTGTIKGVAQFAAEGFKGVASKVGEFLGPVASKVGEVFGKVGSVVKSGFDVVVKTMAAGAAAAAAGIGAVTVAAINGFSEYEQLAGGAKQIFSNMDYGTIAADAQQAYKTMGMSANEYLESINQTGAAFKATMGDEKGYDTAKRGMQAIADYASGTGRNVGELNEKYAMITRSTSSYQSIADQFSGLLPATSAGFLEQAQAAGLLSDEYTSLTEVPIDEYQQAVTGMLEKGTESLGLTGNTAREATETISGSIGMLKGSWSNFVTELGKDDADIEARTGELVDSVIAVGENVIPRAVQIVGTLMTKVPEALAANAPRLMEAATTVLDGITGGAFSKVVEAVAPFAERIGTAAMGMVERFRPLAPVVQDIGGKLGGILMTALEAATGAFEFLAPIISSIAEAVLPLLATNIGTIGDAFDAALTLLEPVGEFFSDVLPPAIEFVGEILQGIADVVADVFGGIKDAADDAADFIRDPIGSIGKLFTGTGKTAQGTQKTVTKSFDAMGRSVKGTATSTTTSVSGSWKALDKATSSSFGAISTTASRQMGSAKTSATKAASGATSSVSKSWQAMASDTNAKLGSVATTTASKMGSAQTSATRAASTAASGVSKSWASMDSDTKAKMGAVATTVDAKTADAQRMATANSEQMRANLAAKYAAMAQKANSESAKVASKTEQNMRSANEKATAQAEKLRSNLASKFSSAATSADTKAKAIKTAWDKSYTMKVSASASTKSASDTLKKFKDTWNNYNISGTTTNSTKKASDAISGFKKTWNGYNISGTATNDTSSAGKSISDFVGAWNWFNIPGTSTADTSSADRSLTKLYKAWDWSTIHFRTSIGNAAGGIAYASGAIVQKHARGFIADRPGRGVDITRHIAGEAGGEAIIPLTNKRYVRPFAETVASFIDGGEGGGVTVTGNTFVVRSDRDIASIAREINRQADRQRRAAL